MLYIYRLFYDTLSFRKPLPLLDLLILYNIVSVARLCLWFCLVVVTFCRLVCCVNCQIRQHYLATKHKGSTVFAWWLHNLCWRLLCAFWAPVMLFVNKPFHGCWMFNQVLKDIVFFFLHFFLTKANYIFPVCQHSVLSVISADWRPWLWLLRWPLCFASRQLPTMLPMSVPH